MRPKIAMWSDYRSPTQKRWRSPYRRTSRSSIGLKILLIATGAVAGVIGISGIYPQIIDSEWVQSAGTHVKRTTEATTTKRTGLITAIPLSPRGTATTTGDAVGSAPRAAPPAPLPPSARAAAEPPSKLPSSVAAVELPPNETASPADIPDAQAKADPPAQAAPESVPPAAGTRVFKPAQRFVARAPVVRKHVARAEHHRSSSPAYAQYGGWGGGWGGGWPGLGSPYHF
jgi:hypothetical protein